MNELTKFLLGEVCARSNNFSKKSKTILTSIFALGTLFLFTNFENMNKKIVKTQNDIIENISIGDGGRVSNESVAIGDGNGGDGDGGRVSDESVAIGDGNGGDGDGGRSV